MKIKDLLLFGNVPIWSECMNVCVLCSAVWYECYSVLKKSFMQKALL